MAESPLWETSSLGLTPRVLWDFGQTKLWAEWFFSLSHLVAANWREVVLLVVERGTCEFKCPWLS